MVIKGGNDSNHWEYASDIIHRDPAGAARECRKLEMSPENSAIPAYKRPVFMNCDVNLAETKVGKLPSGWNYVDATGLNESIEDLSLTANGAHIEVDEDENGKVTITSEPATSTGGETISPISPETEAEITGESALDDPFAEDPAAEEESSEVDVDFDEFDEESMNELGESYFKKVYENVDSFKTTAVKTSGNSMIIEGLLGFTSGNKKSTSFIFEALDATKSGKFRFVGDNKELTEGKKAFMLTGTIDNNKLMVESMNYNYKHADAEGKTARVYGTERIK